VRADHHGRGLRRARPGSFYDPVGALRDVVQNHLLQLAGLIASEPPGAAGADGLSGKRAEVFRDIAPADAAAYVRGQYDGYLAVPGVRPDRKPRPRPRCGSRSAPGAGACSMPRSTGPRWPDLTATTCTAVAPKIPQCLSFSCSGRSGNSAIPAAATCSTATSHRAAQRPTAPTCHPAGQHGSCSPGPPPSTQGQHTLPGDLAAACPEMTALAGLVRSFAALLTPHAGNGSLLQQWIATARAADLPHLRAFTNGLDLDIQAATAALTLPYHNGRTEGVNTGTKMIKRQMYGRAGFTLLRHPILLG
jgi:Glucose-6-phosphate dehydrogenase, C-terminal domain/Transposase